MAGKRSKSSKGSGTKDKPHFHGHRERLRGRFRDAGSDALSDYEMLELVLFHAIPRIDVKPLAKELIEEFGSYAEVLSAPRVRLKKIGGLGDIAIDHLKVVQAAASRMLKGEVKKRQVLSSWTSVLDYCRG